MNNRTDKPISVKAQWLDRLTLLVTKTYADRGNIVIIRKISRILWDYGYGDFKLQVSIWAGGEMEGHAVKGGEQVGVQTGKGSIPLDYLLMRPRLKKKAG